MTRENRDEEVVEIPPETKPKLTLVVILSIVVGILLTLLIGGTAYHFQSRKALVAELATANDELKRKTLQFGELQEQIVGLSRQIHALREFSVAKASSVAAAASTKSPPAPAEPETEKPPADSTPVARKEKPATQDCQLVGKSPEEQAATLKRCAQAVERR